ncbi:MAG: pyrroline-5-carboxylate reductase [Prevotella sp.]|nr:pyrroline-5-carboxylate reductase [Prevotella sp.]
MKIAMIGAGAMGGATVDGLIKGSFVNNADIIVSDPFPQERFAKAGVCVTTDNSEAARKADIVCVCVKPWLVEEVLKGIRPSLRETSVRENRTAQDTSSKTLVVIAAGVSSDDIRQWLGDDCPALLLAIPNIAIAELQSMTFLVPVQAQPQHTERVKAMFDSMGKTIITDEKHLPSGTALASCGIAYALRYIRAAAEGGVELGFRADDATKIVAQTVKGAISLLETTGKHPEQLIDQVTTPGGVTIKGLNAMEEAGFTKAVIKGLV